jgi:transcriptional regulator GlxA family with amidase domain
MQMINHYVEANYQNEIDVNHVAQICNLTTPAFCRYFKKATHYTFTDFLNQFRINQSKNYCYKTRMSRRLAMKAGMQTSPT